LAAIEADEDDGEATAVEEVVGVSVPVVEAVDEDFLGVKKPDAVRVGALERLEEELFDRFKLSVLFSRAEEGEKSANKTEKVKHEDKNEQMMILTWRAAQLVFDRTGSGSQRPGLDLKNFGALDAAIPTERITHVTLNQ
jgi:hypothetical protein